MSLTMTDRLLKGSFPVYLLDVRGYDVEEVHDR
jgi:hypothetical protein